MMRTAVNTSCAPLTHRHECRYITISLSFAVVGKKSAVNAGGREGTNEGFVFVLYAKKFNAGYSAVDKRAAAAT